jgi:hypothetical protein
VDPYASAIEGDAEARALAEVGRRARVARISAGVPILVAGLVLGIAGYLALRELFFESIGVHSPYVTGVLSVLPAMSLAWKLGVGLGRVAVARLSPAWVAELSAAHGVPRETLEQFARMV